MEKIYTMAEIAAMDEIQYNRYFNSVMEEMKLSGQLAYRDEKNKKESFEKGEKEGFERGEKKGFERGEKNGLERGEKKGVEKVAANMLSKGVPIETIAECSGLTQEQILSLKDRQQS